MLALDLNYIKSFLLIWYDLRLLDSNFSLLKCNDMTLNKSSLAIMTISRFVIHDKHLR